MSHIKKYLASFFLFISIISTFYFPKPVLAGDWVLVGKEFGLDAVAWNLASRIVRRITTATVNWINSGFQGSPAFVRNPQQFFLNTADEEASRFLSSTNLGNALCSPFRAQVRLALVKNYLRDEENFSCTLGTLRNNYEQFMGDFSQGGWGGWFELTQNDANNPYGALQQAEGELSLRLGKEQKELSDQLTYGQGILSMKMCPEGYELDPALGTGDCRVEKITTTPGVVLTGKLTDALGSDMDRIVSADEIDEVLSALLEQLTNKLLSSVGLSGLSNAGPGGTPSYTSQLENEALPPPPTPPQQDDYIPPCPSDQGYVCDDDNPGGGDDTGTGGGPWIISGTLDPGAGVNIVGPAPADALTWPETTQITGGNWDLSWNIDFTEEGTWGTCETPGVFGPVSYTIWAFVQHTDGQWYGSAFERNYPGDANSGGPGDPKLQLPRNWWYDTRWVNMFGHYPRVGEQVGFMVTNGNHRLTDIPCTATQSRSNIVLVTIP